ncbi:MAG TPA: PilN domain-containing protein [Phycisphaerales bacterium]|nr:PilN domain-containing protein [Phycisphaerales bacterium]
MTVTAAPSKASAKPTSKPAAKSSARIVAGVDACGDRVSVVVARAGSSVSSAAPGVQIVEARKFSAADKGGVAAMCERLRVSHIVRVAPADACTARAATVPAGDVPGMLAAAALLAEGELPADVPAHRRAGGVLPMQKTGVRPVLLTAWLRDESQPRIADKIDESWTTPMAALAALRGSATAAVLARPAQNAACILVTGDAATAARVIIEDADDADAWREAIADAIAESASASGTPVPDVDAEAVLSITGGFDDLRSRAPGAKIDDAWLADHAAALGAAMIALDVPAGVAPLAALYAVAPKERVPAPVRLATWMSRPAVAWTVGIAAAILLVAGPWALARQRAVVSTSKAAQLDDAKSQTKDLSLRAAMYEQLEASRLPMTKILADIAGATPVGVTIEDARITVEQGVTLRGVAKSRELVNELEKNLGSTRVFRNIKQNRNESKAGGGAEFDLSAQIEPSQVHLPVKPKEDFATTNLAVRLHGPSASNTNIPVGAKREAPRTSRSSSRSSGSSASDSVDTSRRPAATASAEAPPAVTDAEIAAMDRSTAMKGWSTRRSFLQRNSGLDPTVKQRLEDEVTKLRDRMQKATEGGGK